MFGDIAPEDRLITPLEVHKRFTITYFNNTDTATRLGVLALHAVSSSFRGANGESANQAPQGWRSQSAAYISYTDPADNQEYRYYKTPLYNQIKANFFDGALPNNRFSPAPRPQHTLDINFIPFGHGKGNSSGKYHWQTLNLRKIHNQANVISVPQTLFGERIKSGSILLSDYSKGAKVEIVDDGYGNLYDKAFKSNFMTGSLTAQGSGSSIGTVSYTHGLLMITDTGSYQNVGGRVSGSTGWTLKFDSTKTVYEHEYTVVVPEGQFNASTNISTTFQRSGSLSLPSMSLNEMRQVMTSPAEGSYNLSGYNPTPQAEGFVTHSFFAPYVTTIGLYNDHGDLLAVAKTSRPVRNDPELALSFIVRFDI